MLLLPLLVIAVAALAVVMLRSGGPAARAVFLRRTGLTFISVATVLIGIFVAGDTLDDPGGWRAAALIALWLGPMAALCVLAWWRPRPASVVLSVLIAGVLALSIWFAVDPMSWRAFESRVGPVRALASFALAMPTALLGWRRPAVGGVMLLVLGVLPVLVSASGPGFGVSSLVAVSVPPALTGLLYLAAEALSRRATGPGARPNSRTRPAPHS